MSWQLTILLQNVFAAIFALYSRSIAKVHKNAQAQITAVIFSIMYVSGLLWALSQTNIDMQTLSLYIELFIVGGLMFGISNILSFKVFEYMDTAIASLFSTLNTVAAVIASTLLIHEGLTLIQSLGAVLLLWGMWLVLAVNASKSKHNQWIKGMILSIIAAILFGLAIANEKYLLGKMSVPTYIVFGWGFQWLAVVAISLVYNVKRYRLLANSNVLNKSLIAGVLRAGSGFLFILAMVKTNNSSLVSVLSGIKVIIAAVLAAIFLHERQYLLRKLESAVLAVLGIALLISH